MQLQSQERDNFLADLERQHPDELHGCQVTAGTVNYEGPIVVRASSTGSESTVAGIGRLVSAAQAREAPIQRLADSVSGFFCYGVMAASAITFSFWTLAGSIQAPSKKLLVFSPAQSAQMMIMHTWQWHMANIAGNLSSLFFSTLA